MKKILSSLLILLATIPSSFAQNSWCLTDEMLQEYFNANPGMKQQVYQEQANYYNLPTVKGAQQNKAPIITIPVVVHVMHDNGTGNILKAQIDDGIRIINEDFNKLNADTTNVRNIFKPYIADAQIEFKLAKIDPNGNCTEGINRVNTPLTNNASNSIKALSYWNSSSYLNIWLVNNIDNGGGGGSILGYAQFPFVNAPTTYGAVIRHDEWGSIGTSNKDGRTVTHEIGHCFNLFHPFQSACGAFCNSSGDFVCDTPPQFDDNNNSCNFNLNTCSNDANGGTSLNPNPYTSNVPDQLENYMGYGLACLGMFTEGQKDRMFTAFNVYNRLNQLRSAANLVATGTNNGYVPQTCPPIAQIIDQQKKLVCVGGQLTFDEQSYNGPITTYDWEFPGATPSTSNIANPTVTYSTPGTHDVILRVSNSAGADTLVIPNVVYANDTASAINAFNYSDSFENSTAFANDWILIDFGGGARWFRTNNGSFTGNSSIWVNNFTGNTPNEIDYLISPSIDMTQVINPTFKFKLAYKAQAGANDVLKCAISLDCGQTWITRLFLSSGSMNSGTVNGSSSFIPSSPSDWRDFTVTTTAAIRASKNALFRFDFTSGGGNNIYIDDFKIDGQSVGIEDNTSVLENSLNIYPNPVTGGNSTLEFQMKEAQENVSIYLTDVVGKTVRTLYNGSLTSDLYQFDVNTSQLKSGIYFLSIATKEGRITRKLMVR